MRYHCEKPGLYVSLYGETYQCDHPVYDSSTLFKIWYVSNRYDSTNHAGTKIKNNT